MAYKVTICLGSRFKIVIILTVVFLKTEIKTRNMKFYICLHFQKAAEFLKTKNETLYTNLYYPCTIQVPVCCTSILLIP